MLFEEAERRGLQPRWETACGLFSFFSNSEDVFVYYTKLDANSQLGSQICQDKSLTHAFLAREGVAGIPFCYSKHVAEINRFFDAHHPVVQKPLLGMKSHDVRKISRREELDLDHLEDTLFEQYIDGVEYRCLVLGETIAMQRKTLDPTDDYPWRKHIANLDRSEWLADLPSLSDTIARRLRMRFMAVDFIVDALGTARVLELNGMPGLHSFSHPDEGAPVEVASALLDAIVAGTR